MHLKLPDRFIQKMSDVGDADLLLIIGTSLTVHPFTSLAGMADRKSCQRVLINLQPVGDLGGRPNDLVLLGDCDATVRELCVALGWERELETTWAETAPTTWAETAPKSKEKSEEEEAAEKVVAGTEESHKEGEKLGQEVNKIAETLEKRLDLSECPTPPTLPKDTSSTTTTTPNASSTEQLAEETEGWKL
ncbi:hypothetical protein C0991_011121 [Blastosporella zonata]|nr:hypothetical protein C0991_011121 [Blastosporella zonata]